MLNAIKINLELCIAFDMKNYQVKYKSGTISRIEKYEILNDYLEK